MYKQLPSDIRLTDNQNNTLLSLFSDIDINPYANYVDFKRAIASITKLDAVADVADGLATLKERNLGEFPFVYIENCPIDLELPELDWQRVAESKRAKKTSYVSESFLEFYNTIMATPAIGYLNVNDGDIFHDIHPQENLKQSQSQKTLAPIGFHKDLANHFVRPDFVNIISLRSNPKNEIYTTFVSNNDILKIMSDVEVEIMKQDLFYTPFDDLTTYGGRVEVGRAKDHAILLKDDDIVYFENRTVGLTPEAQAVVEKIKVELHNNKYARLMRPGDFVGIANNHSVHGKDVYNIADPVDQRRRWSMKTVNVFSIEDHAHHLVAGSQFIING